MSEFFVPKLDPNCYTFSKVSGHEEVVAWGGDLNPNRLIAAYKSGIFPWFNEDDPILWWCPNPRCVLFLEDIKISKSLKKSLKKFTITYDKDFSSVIRQCRQVRSSKNEDTWISKDMIKSYESLHKRGFAHSVETWYEGELVGGLYGVCMGKIFCGESMFSKKSDASKVALVNLVQKLQKFGFELIDCQVSNPHLLSLGAKEIPKKEFLKKLQIAINQPSGFDEFSQLGNF
ncbi:MAG: leucyl/phenylalanyl-tRNA--protein transferase [Proteobacteria bacterium]|nr:MAG: leucyl/phenylalanyl-tRNA--protein transferase [Pseudomonadota bacterium]